MHRTFAPRLFTAAAAAALLLACVRVGSVPEPTSPRPSYSWDTALSQMVADIDATITGLRQEFAEQKATYVKMYNDTRMLEEKLSSPTSLNR